jgi:hypothetical protein
MFYVRASLDASQDSIAAILSIIWQIVSSVNGIVYKDLKQTLKKEQCDVKINFNNKNTSFYLLKLNLNIFKLFFLKIKASTIDYC